MQLSDEQIDRACHLGPEDAVALLEKGRGGDFPALAEWTVYSLFRRFRGLGMARAAALQQTRALVATVDLQPRMVP